MRPFFVTFPANWMTKRKRYSFHRLIIQTKLLQCNIRPRDASKSEIRISKFETNSNDQNSKSKTDGYLIIQKNNVNQHNHEEYSI